MDEIKPVVWRCVWITAEGECEWSQYHDAFDPLPSVWDEAPDEVHAYYDKQAIDTLRAEVERQKELISDLNSIISGIPAELRRASQAKQELSDFLIARAERAEAEAQALRKLIGRVVAEANWRTSSNDLWFELVKATRETAIDAAKQAAE